MGYGYGPGMMGGIPYVGILFMLVYFAVVAYALFLVTQISRSLQRIAASLERSGPRETVKHSPA